MSIVFISYSHDSDAHKKKVLGLSERLREDGIDTRLDQYVGGTPPEKWPRWMLDRLDEAEFVLVVCTETYYRRFRGHEEPGKGKGADWEGALITQEIYNERSRTLKFIPVLFAPEDEEYIPEPLRGHTHYLLTSEANYEALYDFLLGQAGVEPRLVGKPRQKERLRGTPLTFDEAHNAPPIISERIAPSRLRHGAAKLFGRDDELAALNAAWENPATNVLSIVAWGGVGKTSLVATWTARLAGRGYDGARYFDWSFYSQGTRDQASASSDPFIAKALEFFGDPQMADSPASLWDKGTRLAQLVARERTLLVLDGLEPMQYPPGVMGGKLRDDALAALLRGLAQRNSGLCVVTTRESVADLFSFRDTTAPEWKLEHLTVPAGAELLRSLGVRGMQAEIDRLVTDVKGHALTLNLLGGFLARAHGGDIRRRDRVHFEKADVNIQGGHALKAMAAYERWLDEGGEAGARQLAILRLLGLFDRPADSGCLKALRKSPPIAGLTDPLVGLEEDEWNLAVALLTDCGLVSWGEEEASAADREKAALDAHPLIREYFATQLRRQNAAAWRAAHSRLFDHLKDTVEYRPDTLIRLQPLYQAVVHGCHAGRHQEAHAEVYEDRILRGKTFYSINKLGAFGAEVSAVACFFESPWNRVSPLLSQHDQGWMLNHAGAGLRSLGRLYEAIEPLRRATQQFTELDDSRNAAISATNLSDLELLLGEVHAAIIDAENAVILADKSGEMFEQIGARATLADALHQSGRRDDASAVFHEAESIQAARQPSYPLLYSIQGFQHREFLLSNAEHAAWQVVLAHGDGTPSRYNWTEISSHTKACGDVLDRNRKMFEWRLPSDSLLDIAVDHLSFSRAAFYSTQITRLSTAMDVADARLQNEAREHVDAAVDGLRRAGTVDELPRGLLTRAWLRSVEGDNDAARADLNEAWQIAERGPMRLYMADIHLYRARLFHAVEPYPWGSPREDLAAARRLIEQCGYWRRKEELEDAEAAAKHW